VQEAKASAEPVVLFESVERRFGAQAWVAMAVAGLTGSTDHSARPLGPLSFGRVLVDGHEGGAVAAVHLDAVRGRAAGPRSIVLARAEIRPESTFRLIERLHWILLVLSLITLIGAILGSQENSLAAEGVRQGSFQSAEAVRGSAACLQ
jgi:hypothetical protein